MGQPLAKPSSEPVDTQNGNKKASSMNKKPELSNTSPAGTGEEGNNSFRLLSELHGDLRNILQLLEQHDVRDFRLEKGDERISLKRGKDDSLTATSYAPSYSNSTPQIQAAPSSGTAAFGVLSNTAAPAAPQTVLNVAVHPPAGEQVVTPNKSYKEITSPMVGTFYRRPAVDAEPYVEVGDVVKKGDVLCIVEAMKLMNEIEAEMSGKIVEVCLDDAQMVEYGEVLFRIEPQ